MLRVLHLVGSPTDEFYAELSRLYAADALAAVADRSRYEAVVAHVDPGGGWRFPHGDGPDALNADRLAAAPVVPVGEALRHIAALGVDVIVPQMFCRAGMTSYRALFDVLGIPYVGNRPEAMALGADKARARAVVAAAGVDVPPAQLLRPGDDVHMEPPLVIKPVDADNSLGVTLVRSRADLGPAVAAAFEHSAEVLAERYVELGREVRCGVLERDGTLVGLPLEEYRVDSKHKPIRGLDDKINRDDGGRLGLVAKDDAYAWIVDPSDPLTAVVHEAAFACHRAMGARHYSLFDFRVDPDGHPWFLEAGLYCSFARKSVVATMARAAGIEIPELFAAAVAQALT